MGALLRQYLWVFNLGAILLCSFFMAKIVGVYISSQLEVESSVGIIAASSVPKMQRELRKRSYYDVVVERNIFDSSEQAVAVQAEDEVADKPKQITGEAVLTSLNVKVLGVLVVGNGKDNRSSATIDGGGKSGKKGRGGSNVYAVGDKESFAPNTVLTKIAPDRIEFVHNGRLEYAKVGDFGGDSIFGPPKYGDVVASKGEVADKAAPRSVAIKQEAPGKFTIDQAEVDNALQNLDKLYTEIRAVPNFSGGKISGMKVLSVKNGSIFAKLGLKRGDILQKINGMELDVKQGFAIFSQLKDSKNLTVDLIRGGQAQSFDYEIR